MVHTGKPGLQAEFVCVESSNCFIMPASMSFDEAAAFPVNYLTAYFCLFDIGSLRSNQTVVIPSAAGEARYLYGGFKLSIVICPTSIGGVGWAATQLAKSVPDVRVIGLASPSKHEAIRANGVDVTIDSRDPCWDTAVKVACPQGVDIALDCTSGDNFRRTQLLVKDLGRAILIGVTIL